MQNSGKETLLVEMDAVVAWYVNFLLFNIFKVPEPLVVFVEKNDDAEVTATIDLLRYLLVARLAKEKLDSCQGMQKVVASEKLLQNSVWLLSGNEPDKRTHQYMSRLVRNALRFLQKRMAA